MKFDILNRWSGEVQFTAEIDCAPDALSSIKMGLAIRCAVKEAANLRGADLYGANLYGADLHGANLRGAILRGANRASFDPAIPGWRLVAGNVLDREVSL